MHLAAERGRLRGLGSVNLKRQFKLFVMAAFHISMAIPLDCEMVLVVLPSDSSARTYGMRP